MRIAIKVHILQFGKFLLVIRIGRGIIKMIGGWFGVDAHKGAVMEYDEEAREETVWGMEEAKQDH